MSGTVASATTTLLFAQGGYFMVSAAFVALVLSLAAGAVAAFAKARPLSLIELVVLGAALLLSLWLLVPRDAASATVVFPELARNALYFVGLLLVLLLAERRFMTHVVAGVLLACVLASAYALATRLSPRLSPGFDPIADYRLAEPLGYWNALGVVAAVGAVLATGVADRATSRSVRALAAASLLVLIPAMYFTYSRAAWLALVAGLVGIVAFEKERLHLATTIVIVAPWPAVAIAIVHTSPELAQAPPLRDGSVGATLALELVVLAVAAYAAVFIASTVATRVSIPSGVRRGWAVVLVGGLLGGAVIGLVRADWSPATFSEAYREFSTPRPVTTDPSGRLLSASGSGRADLWRAAWDQWRSAPLVGTGPGTFERYWLQNRPTINDARDAHNVYLETLAELGLGGLILLVTLLGAPLAAALRVRDVPLVPAAAGVLIAYALHAGLDWDWELPGVTLPVIFCAGAILVAARNVDEQPRLAPRAFRVATVTAALALVPIAFVGVIGQGATSAGYEAFAEGNDETALAQARKATRWMPWSSAPWQLLGEVRLAAGDRREAANEFRTAVEKDDHDWRLWYGLARATTGRAQTDAFTRALLLNPRSSELRAFEGDRAR